MSTTMTETYAFPKAEARPKPTLICVGNVGEISDGYISGKSGIDYVVIPIAIDPLDGGKRTKVYFTHRPEWLTNSFKPYLLKKDSPSAYFVYSKNIAAEEEFSLLRGLAGNEDAFKKLADTLLRLPVDPEVGGPNPGVTTEALREFFANNVDATGQSRKVGYELKQQRTFTGDTDEDGKKIYVLENRYNVNSFWDVTEKGIKKATNRANTSNGDVVMTFAGTPF